MWLPKELKDRVKEGIPEEFYDKIATEDDAGTVVELEEFLHRVGHPWLTA
jgi:acetyl-CoA decarbonylase/synthase complex subunit beta